MIKRFKILFVDAKISINSAIRQLEKGHKRILFIFKNKKFIGVFEDSDLRRALIYKKDLNKNILSIANPNPKFIYKNKFSRAKLNFIFKNYNCVAVPVLNKKKEIVDIFFNKSIYHQENNQISTVTAVIMAGGLGKRLRPITRTTPKPLVKYKSKPIILRIINNLIKNKINKIIVTVNYKKNKIIKYINKKKFKANISFMHEKSFLGTAGSLRKLKNKNFKNIFVINGDVITELDIMSLEKYHIDNKLDLSVVTKTIDFRIPYGMIDTQDIFLKSVEEKPIITKSIIVGAYMLSSKCLKVIPQGRFDMPDLITCCIKKKYKIGYYPTYEKYKHITSKEDLK
jgi:dTDP-glucose pyrophosphorylase